MMRMQLASLCILAVTTLSSGLLHHLIVGTFTDPHLYTLAFDDEALTLELVKTTNTSDGSFWIHLSHDKKNLYGTLGLNFSSWEVLDAASLVYTNSLPLGGNCTTSRSIYVTSASEAPYNVYGVPFGMGPAGCGVVMSVSDKGALDSVLQEYTYLPNSGVHGLALSSNNDYIYSADDSANSLWTHSVDPVTGLLTFISRIDAPTTTAAPRHLAAHPGGAYLYAILEADNSLASYHISNTTGIPIFTNVTWPLIPRGFPSVDYWSDEVAMSFSGSYLWATSRAHNINQTGFITVFSLAPDGEILEQLFLTPTTSSGGTANAVTPADFNDRWAALTDSSIGFVEIWRLADDGSKAEVVAHLKVGNPVAPGQNGCCANAVWYD